jgi:hypothetical protein
MEKGARLGLATKLPSVVGASGLLDQRVSGLFPPYLCIHLNEILMKPLLAFAVDGISLCGTL